MRMFKNPMEMILILILINIILSFYNNKISNNTHTFNDNFNISEETFTKFTLDTNGLMINSIYTDVILSDFINDGVRNGLDSLSIIKRINRLDAIILEDLSKDSLLGITIFWKDSLNRNRGIILLDYRILNNYNIYKFVLYHELGHWFGLNHSECVDEIMLPAYDYDNVNNILVEWDEKVSDFMRKIKESLD